MAWQELLAGLETSRQLIDKTTASCCEEDREPRIYCQPGCGSCCSLAVNCSFPEALAISRQLTSDLRGRLYGKISTLKEISQQAGDLKEYLRLFRRSLGGCAFLAEDGCCSIYSFRPFSCRALLSTRNSSWCAIDITSLHPLEKEAFLSSLDPQVVAFPTHYLAASQELGMELEAQSLVAMRDCFGVAISGSLIYQVWLELEHNLSEKVFAGASVVQSYLEQHRLGLPFLLQLQGQG